MSDKDFAISYLVSKGKNMIFAINLAILQKSVMIFAKTLDFPKLPLCKKLGFLAKMWLYFHRPKTEDSDELSTNESGGKNPDSFEDRFSDFR